MVHSLANDFSFRSVRKTRPCFCNLNASRTQIWSKVARFELPRKVWHRRDVNLWKEAVYEWMWLSGSVGFLCVRVAKKTEIFLES